MLIRSMICYHTSTGHSTNNASSTREIFWPAFFLTNRVNVWERSAFFEPQLRTEFGRLSMRAQFDIALFDESVDYMHSEKGLNARLSPKTECQML